MIYLEEDGIELASKDLFNFGVYLPKRSFGVLKVELYFPERTPSGENAPSLRGALLYGNIGNLVEFFCDLQYLAFYRIFHCDKIEMIFCVCAVHERVEERF